MKIILSVINDLVSDQRVHKVCLSLQKMGHNVTLLGRKLPNSPPLANRAYRTKRMRLLFVKGAFFYAEFNIRLFLHLLFSNYDVLVANDLDTLLATYLAAKIRNKKVVYDSHEFFTEVPELIGRNFARNSWLAIECWILPKLKHTYTVCQTIADEYMRLYHVDMLIVRNIPISNQMVHFDAPDLKKTHFGNKKIILYQGALNVGRGIEYVIEAMKYTQNAVFVLIGDGDITQKLKDLSKKFEVENKVFFLGKIPFERLYSYTIQADIGICLQEDTGLSYRYVLPNRLFDYIHANLPVLCSQLPELQSIVSKYEIGILTESTNAKEISELITKMLNDNELRKFWKTNLRLSAQELTWENEEKKLETIYGKL